MTTTTTTPATALNIDKLKPQNEVNLRFHGSKRLGNAGYVESYVFLRIEGEGEDRRAIFDGFEAYRYDGHWAYGSSAERLTIAR